MYTAVIHQTEFRQDGDSRWSIFKSSIVPVILNLVAKFRPTGNGSARQSPRQSPRDRGPQSPISSLPADQPRASPSRPPHHLSCDAMAMATARLVATAAAAAAACACASASLECEPRCTGAAALQPGFAPCLLPKQAKRATSALSWVPGRCGALSLPEAETDCHFGTYFADGGRCPLRLLSKADVLNCHRQEMQRLGKRSRFIFLGASTQFSKVKALIDVLDEGRGTSYSTRGSTPPYNMTMSSGATTWAQAASGTLDLIYDRDMKLRYIKEGSGDLHDGEWFPRAQDVRDIQNAPDFGPGSVRITWFGARYGVDVAASLRLARGLRAAPSPR
eukprot:SAG31_NODE_1291_length_8975_cov_26.197274_7_plen_333_part_00